MTTMHAVPGRGLRKPEGASVTRVMLEMLDRSESPEPTRAIVHDRTAQHELSRAGPVACRGEVPQSLFWPALRWLVLLGRYVQIVTSRSEILAGSATPTPRSAAARM